MSQVTQTLEVQKMSEVAEIAKRTLRNVGWVELAGYDGAYYTDGKSIISFKKYKEGQVLTWAQGTRGLMISLRAPARTVTPSALEKAYAAGGVLPASRIKVENTTLKGKSKFTYLAAGKVVTVHHIVARTGLTKDTVLGRLKKYGYFRHNGVKFERR